MMVVDAHVHFWDPGALRYAWLDATPALRRPYLPRDYTDDARAMVFVEANCAPHENIDEVALVERFAAVEPRIAGIVAYVDMLDEPRRSVMLEQLAHQPRVVGIRHNIQGQLNGFCLDKRFVRGVQAVGRRGYPFDVCVTADQLGDVVALVERCPDTRFVLDHCGKPAIRNDRFGGWARDLQRLARCRNVSCKLSGLLTESRADQHNAHSLAPYVEHAHACFGATRLLYGSDWPVLTMAAGLDLWRSIVDELTAHWTAADRECLFAENAIQLYRLDVNVD